MKKKTAKKPAIKKATKKQSAKALAKIKKESRITLVDETEGSFALKQKRERLQDLKTQIVVASQTVGAQFFLIGCALRTIRDEALWRCEKATSFNEWITKQTTITRPTVYNLIAVAEHLNQKEAERYGPSVSYVVARGTSEGARQELQKLASDGATSQELKSIAKRQREEEQVVRSPGRTAKPAVSVSNGGESRRPIASTISEVVTKPKKRKPEVVETESGTFKLTACKDKGFDLQGVLVLPVGKITVKINVKKKVVSYEAVL